MTFKKFYLLIALLATPMFGQAANFDIDDIDLYQNVDANGAAVVLPEQATRTINMSAGDLTELDVISLSGFDVEQPNEGSLVINGDTANTITLFGTESPGANDQDGIASITLSAGQKAAFQVGNNTLLFIHSSGAGYTITNISTTKANVTKVAFTDVTPIMGGDISANRLRALEIYKRLVGLTTAIDNPLLVQMEADISAGNLLAAAQKATSEQGFLNHVVRDLAAKMSTREETVKEPLNDFIAGVIGVTKDGTDARELLTSNMFYWGRDVPVRKGDLADLVESNNHYDDLIEGNYDLGSVLVRREGQLISNGNTAIANPDPAGIITSRAFLGAHAIAGTNRRLVEYTMRQFACTPIEGWADAQSPDIRVGVDVTRFPAGNPEDFQTTCKACHGNMDGFRGAFAKFNFADTFVEHSGNNVQPKMNQNADTGYANGYTTTDDSWVNYARSPANTQLFGWRGNVTQGRGVNQFATAVANSKAFSKCMVERVYNELCRRDIAEFELQMVDDLANWFESANYNMKSLFEAVSVRPECIGY